MRLLPSLLACCLSFSALNAAAAEVKGLFDVREPVTADTTEERAAALSRALQTLTVRLTGDRRSANDARLRPLLADPQQLVQKFVYEPGTPVMLSVTFDQPSTEKALHDKGLTLWPNPRPQVLTWWLETSASGAHLVAEDQTEANILREAARTRGLPLHLPLGDLQEQLLATHDTLNNADATLLRKASEAYAADALLAVVAHVSANDWQADWQLFVNNERVSGKAQAAGRQALAENIVVEVTEALAKRFAASAGQTLTLEIQGSDLVRYAALQQTLQPYQATLRSIEGSTLTFHVKADPQQLKTRLQTARLHEIPATTTQADGVNRLIFSW